MQEVVTLMAGLCHW